MDLKDRFLKYVSFDTQSDENSTTFPSTDRQLVLLNHLADEMRSLGLQDVTVDKYGYAMGTIPATEGCENAPVIGFISHVDTSPDMSGKDVKPHVIENYPSSRSSRATQSSTPTAPPCSEPTTRRVAPR